MKKLFWSIFGSFLRPFEYNRRCWANARYYERQAAWKRLDHENKEMQRLYKEEFDRELTPHPVYADDPVNPPFPEVE
jgi:hypothetical protein